DEIANQGLVRMSKRNRYWSPHADEHAGGFAVCDRGYGMQSRNSVQTRHLKHALLLRQNPLHDRGRGQSLADPFFRLRMTRQYISVPINDANRAALRKLDLCRRLRQ